jgi:hypothetical protein
MYFEWEVLCRLWMKVCGMKRSQPVLSFCPSIYLEGLRKITKPLNQDSFPIEIRARYLMNMKQEPQRRAFYLHIISLWKMGFCLNVLILVFPAL